MLFTSVLIIAAFVVGTCVVLTIRERRQQAACARVLRREVAELDLRWPVHEDAEIPQSETGCEPTPYPGELPCPEHRRAETQCRPLDVRTDWHRKWPK